MQPSRLRSILLVGLVVFCSPTLARANDVAPSTWSEVREAANSFLEQGAFDEALALIEAAAPNLQGREFEVSDLTAQILCEAGRTDEALAVWEEGVEAGFFYFIIPRSSIYDGVRRDDRFRRLVARNNRLRDIARSESKPEYRVIKPASYSARDAYPLLMIIHGGNQSIVKAMDRWDPAVIGDDMIIAYVQSSMPADTKSYRWDLGGVDIYSLPTAQDEVLGLYREIVRDYAVDTEQVMLAGFSQGGNLALFMAAEGTIPAKGFIAGCPATRTPVPPETALIAAARGLRGTIFVGSNDWTAESAQTTVSNFEESGVQVNHLVMEDKGHEFPDDFDDVLREAIEQILQ